TRLSGTLCAAASALSALSCTVGRPDHTPRYVRLAKGPMRQYPRTTASDRHEQLFFMARRDARETGGRPMEAPHERRPKSRQPDSISAAATPVRPRQRARAAHRRKLRAVLHEDRKNLRTRASDAPRLLRRPVLRRTRKDVDGQPLEPCKESVMKCSHPMCH